MAESQRHILAPMLSFVNGTPADIIVPMQASQEYYSYREFTITLGGEQIRYFSKPGIHDWDIIPPAFHLLVDYSHPNPTDHVWCINCGPGALAACVAKKLPLGVCQVSTNDILSYTATQLTQSQNYLDNLGINLDIQNSSPSAQKFDLILMGISKGRSLNRRWLAQAWLALKAGGRLLVAGANDHGVQSVLKDAAEIFHNLSILAYKKGNRIGQCIKSDSTQVSLPPWMNEPGIAPGTWQTIQATTTGSPWDLVSLPGVFSGSALDPGTLLLLSTLGDGSGQRVLDIGCGYGIVGLTAALHDAASVDLVDSQFFAVASCQENINRTQLSQCQVYCSDLFSAVRGKSYTCILSNPPFHAGHQVDYQIAQALIINARAALEPHGYLQLVANRFIRYDRLMFEHFGNISVLADTPAYHVLISQKE